MEIKPDRSTYILRYYVTPIVGAAILIGGAIGLGSILTHIAKVHPEWL